MAWEVIAQELCPELMVASRDGGHARVTSRDGGHAQVCQLHSNDRNTSGWALGTVRGDRGALAASRVRRPVQGGETPGRTCLSPEDRAMSPLRRLLGVKVNNSAQSPTASARQIT